MKGDLMSLPVILVLFTAQPMSCSYQFDSLLQEVMSRLLNNEAPDFDLQAFDSYGPISASRHTPSPSYEAASERVAKEYGSKPFRTRHDNILGREPSIRDQEYLQHSSLFGHQYVEGGAGEGYQRLKPDGSMKNLEVVKTDGVLPAYCDPPNPCPLGYTADDGCLEDFVNSAQFSQQYEAAQECMCDTEHMFDCPGSTRDNEIDALARSIQNEGVVDSTLNRLVESMQIEGQHKSLVAKKFFDKKAQNPYLEGEKLPVVAKKTPQA